MKKGVNTNLLHGYPVIDNYTGAASIPKYQTSTFDQKEIYFDSKKYCYSRFCNPTIDALQKAIAKLENSEYAFAFSSGMAAITTALLLFEAGDHIIFPKEVYGGTYQLSTVILPKYKIESSFIDCSCLNNIEKHIKENTKAIYIETPSNPLLKISDIIGIVELAKKYNLLTIIDNTFMTPIYQKPLELGCDIVVESMTKFINGHSDVVAGLLATNNEKIAKEVALLQKNFGAIMGVEDAWLILRGIKTLGIRMEKSVSNAIEIAKFLETKEKIKKVYYPELESCKYYSVHSKQATSGGAVLSFEFYNEEDRKLFLERIEIPIYAVSLGGVESIISHPATMSHACMSKEEREEQGISDNLLRLSCGIEDLEDLINDLENSLK